MPFGTLNVLLYQNQGIRVGGGVFDAPHKEKTIVAASAIEPQNGESPQGLAVLLFHNPLWKFFAPLSFKKAGVFRGVEDAAPYEDEGYSTKRASDESCGSMFLTSANWLRARSRLCSGRSVLKYTSPAI